MEELLPIAEQLNILFDAVKQADGRTYTMQQVSDQTGVSLATISQLRNGKIRNPQLKTLRSLCRFFNTPLRYFETTSTGACYAILAELHQSPVPEISEIAFRASGLSPKSQRDVLTIIKWVQAAEEQHREATLPPLPGLEDYDESAGNERA